MPKLRKMLGDVNAECTKELMRLIQAQSKKTLCTWCMDYAEKYMLSIYKKYCPNDDRPKNALITAKKYNAGEIKWSEAKLIIWYEGAYKNENPIAQAADKAVGQAASLGHSPTAGHSLGFYFYGAAAIAYDKLGLTATVEEYQCEAEKVCIDMTAALRKIAVENEPNPVKVMWEC